MDNETKVTYGIIVVLIIFLGGIAYILRSTTPTKETQTDQTAMLAKQLTSTTPAAAKTPEPATTTKPMEQQVFTSAIITTNKGVIEVEFDKEKVNTVKNFGTLASSHFYDGVRFHRVINNFMIQSGDPLSKDLANKLSWGTGGPGYKFNDELTGKEQYPLGTLAMANSGPNTNGSQFFIVTANPGVGLPPSYTVFGKVTKGIETALAIQGVKTDSSDRPVEDVIIEKVEVK